MGGIFVFGLCAGVFLTLLAASSVPDRDTHEDNRPQDMRKRSQNLLQASVSVAPALLRPDFWIETVSDVPGPRIYVLHNMLSAAECEHLKALGVMAGMEKALIIPYGGKDLVESTTRTNTAAWLDFQQDDVVSRVERILANVTNTEPENGENENAQRRAGAQRHLVGFVLLWVVVVRAMVAAAVPHSTSTS